MNLRYSRGQIDKSSSAYPVHLRVHCRFFASYLFFFLVRIINSSKTLSVRVVREHAVYTQARDIKILKCRLRSLAFALPPFAGRRTAFDSVFFFIVVRPFDNRSVSASLRAPESKANRNIANIIIIINECNFFIDIEFFTKPHKYSGPISYFYN